MNEKLEKTFQIAAVILIGIAAFFLWKGNTDWLFITAVLGSVCFFLSYRFQVKERLEQRDRDKAAAEVRDRRDELTDSAEDDGEFFPDENSDVERQTVDKHRTSDYL